jgi:hypothetical protein
MLSCYDVILMANFFDICLLSAPSQACLPPFARVSPLTVSELLSLALHPFFGLPHSWGATGKKKGSSWIDVTIKLHGNGQWPAFLFILNLPA